MNWLAHLILSEPTVDFRLGNILPDLVPVSQLIDMPPDVRRGIERHREIDSYADSNAIFQRSVERFKPPLRRYGGILVDVFYDHFLARSWQSYASIPLADFVQEFYASLDSKAEYVPLEACRTLDKMRSGDWLGSYIETTGIASALGRISARLSRPFDHNSANTVLESDYKLFGNDFDQFFPELYKRYMGS